MVFLYKILLVFYGENEVEYGNLIEDMQFVKCDWFYFFFDDKFRIYLGGIFLVDFKEKFGVDEYEL